MGTTSSFVLNWQWNEYWHLEQEMPLCRSYNLQRLIWSNGVDNFPSCCAQQIYQISVSKLWHSAPQFLGGIFLTHITQIKTLSSLVRQKTTYLLQNFCGSKQLGKEVEEPLSFDLFVYKRHTRFCKIEQKKEKKNDIKTTKSGSQMTYFLLKVVCWQIINFYSAICSWNSQSVRLVIVSHTTDPWWNIIKETYSMDLKFTHS